MFILVFILFLFQSSSLDKRVDLKFWSNDENNQRAITQVWDIAKDANDRLILSTTPAFIEFNGREFSRVEDQSTRSVASDNQGRVYYGAESDFGYFDKNKSGELASVSLKDKFFHNLTGIGQVFDTHVIDDRVYFRSPTFLFVFYQNKMSIVIEGKSLHRTYPFNDQLFVSIRGEAPVFVKDSIVKSIPNAEQFATELFYCGIDLGSYLLIGSRTSGFYQVTENGIESVLFPASIQLGKTNFYNAELLPDSIIAFATKSGVLFIQKNGIVVGELNAENGLPENNVLSVKYEAPNSLWIGMGASIARLEYPQALITFKLRNGIEASNYGEIVEFKNELYLSAGEGVFKYSLPSNTDVSLFNRGEFKPVEIPKNQYLGLLVHNNELFAGSIEGLFKGNGTRFKKLNSVYVRTIVADIRDENLLWLGSNEGLLHYNIKQNKSYKRFEIPSTEEILTILPVQDSVLWIGTVAGSIFKINLNSSEVISWNVNEFTTDKRLYPIFLSNFERKIRAHTVGQLHVFEDDKQTFIPDINLNKSFNLEALPIYRLFFNDDLVLYDYKGFVQLNHRKTGEAFHTYPLRSLDLITSAVFGDKYIWMLNGGTVSKITFPPKEKKIKYDLFPKHHPVAINREKSRSDTLYITNRSILPIDYNNLEFSFDVSSFTLDDKILYRTRLKGFQSEWSYWNAKNKIEFSYLPSGDYTIMVEAMGRYGKSNLIQVSFTIDKVWYLKTWSLLVFGVLFLGVLIAIGFSISKQVKSKELAIYEQKIREEEIQRREKELNDAREFQMSLLPKKLPNLAYFETQVLMKTATEVGGDYYDFFNQDNDELIAVIGDASGHGTTAGMMVQITKAGLIANIKQHQKPDLTIVNDIFLALGQRRVKMSLTMLDISKEKVRVIMAAMPPIFWYKAASKTCEEVLDNTVPMGSRLFKPGNPIDIAWEKDDILVLMSDGLPEWKNHIDEELGYEKLKQHILANNQLPLDEFLSTMVQVGTSHANGIEADDDITLLVLKKTL